MKRAIMDKIQTCVFTLMILFFLTNKISGASLGNVQSLNETLDDAEEQHRAVLQNIQKNYADEFRNYEMGDIENFISGFMTPQKKKPIFTSKTFFGSDQFFGPHERSKDNTQGQTWDPFRANRVIGSQPSYFDVPDDLFQQYVNSKNNGETSHLKTGDENSSDIPRGIENLSKDKLPVSEVGSRTQENDLSHSIDNEVPIDQLHDIFNPVDDAEDHVTEFSKTKDGDTKNDADELSRPKDAGDEVDEQSRPEDDDGDDSRGGIHELSRPEDDVAEEFNELSRPEDDDDAEDEVNELSRPEDDDDAEDEVNELSLPEDDDDAEDEVNELSRPEDDDEVNELSRPEDDDAEDEVNELSRPEDDDDTEDEISELSRPEDAEDEVNELFPPEDDDNTEDEVNELSPLEDGDAENHVDELSLLKDDDVNDLTRPEEDDADDVNELSLSEDDDENDLSHPEDDDAENDKELSRSEDGDAANDVDEPSHRENDDAADMNEPSRPEDEDEDDELSHVDDGDKDQVDEISTSVKENTKDSLDGISRPVGNKDEIGKHSHLLQGIQGLVDEPFHLVNKTQDEADDAAHTFDGTKVQFDELFTSKDDGLGSKDILIDEAAMENEIGRQSSSTAKGGLDDSIESQDVSAQSVDDAFGSREDELISEEDDIESEFIRVSKLNTKKVIEDHSNISANNSFENSKNGSDILPLDQSVSESRFGATSDEHLEKAQSVGDFDLMVENINFDKVTVTTEDLDLHKIDVEEFQGSGDMGDSFIGDGVFRDTKLESKSGRIVDVFSRRNDTVECTTPKGERGRCLSLRDCPLSDPLNNFGLFLQYVCLSRGILVGICCPDNPVVEISDATDNSTMTDNSTAVELKQPKDGCGLNTNTRIVGGKISFPHEWTWMVALLRRNRFFCGGVIINDWYILTAAHCVMGIKVSDLKVRLGEYNFNEKNEHQEDIQVAEIKRHALFVTLTFQHDIALLKLKRRIEYTKFIGSICLPNPKSGNFSDVNATVVGWGTVSFGGTASPILRQVTVPVWDNEECDKTYRLERITDAFLCAGSPENGEDACQGDSGGPLMALSEEGRWEVIGIVSWGRRCGDPTFPGVYTRVSTYLDWIAENSK